MATPIWIEGWEHGALASAGGGIATSLVGTPSISSTTYRTGAYAMRSYAASSAANYITKSVSGSPTFLVARLYIRFATLPAASANILQFVPAAGYYVNVEFYQPSSCLAVTWGGVSRTSGAVVTTGTWYRVDFRADCSGSTWSFDWQIDGSAQTQATYAQAASTFATIRVGISTSTTYDIFYDDIVVSATSGDYPLGAGSVVGLSPTGEGTHSAGTVIKDTSGNVINGTTYQAYPLLDDVPMTSTADYVQQDGTGSYYAEVTFADTAETSIVGAQAYLAYHASGATPPNDGEARIVDEDATETDIYDGDMSETTLSYKSVMLPAPAGGWDQAAVNALKARVGYSSDIAPVPYWDALMIQVAIGAGATAYSLSCSGGSYAVTGAAVSPLRAAKVAIGAGEYAVTGGAAGAHYGRAIDADAGAYDVTGGAVTMPRTYRLAPDAGVYALTGTALAALYGRLLSAGAGSYALTGQDAALLRGFGIAADAGSYSLTGQDVATLRAALISAGAGTYAITGQDVTLLYTPGGGTYTITADGGVYAVTGGDVGVLRGAKVAADAGAYIVTGQAASALLGRMLDAGAGVYAMSGADAALVRAAKIAIEAGVYTLTGADVNALLGRLLSAETGTYALTGADASLLRDALVAIGAGTYDISGQAATLTYSGSGQYTLACEAGSYVITGTAADLLKHILHPDTIYPKAPDRSISIDGPKRTAVVGEKHKATVSRRRTWS